MARSPLFTTALVIGAAGVLAGCSTYGGRSYGGVSVGYGGGYYDDGYYGYDRGYYGDPYYGWYDNYYYPGTGYYVYDRGGRRHAWSRAQQRYWAARRAQWRGRGDARDNWDGYRRERREDLRERRADRREDLRERREDFRERRRDRRERSDGARPGRPSGATRPESTRPQPQRVERPAPRAERRESGDAQRRGPLRSDLPPADPR